MGKINLNNAKCIICGGELSFDGEEMASELFTKYAEDDEAVLHYLKCKKCGRNYELLDPMKEEKESDFSEYWKNR